MVSYSSRGSPYDLEALKKGKMWLVKVVTTKYRASLKDILDFRGYDRQEIVGAANLRKATAVVAMYCGMNFDIYYARIDRRISAREL